MIRTQEDFKNIVYECLGELSALNVASDNMTEKLCDIEIESFNNRLAYVYKDLQKVRQNLQMRIK